MISEINENAKKVLEKRYLIKDADGNTIETLEGLFRRVAKAIANADTANQLIGFSAGTKPRSGNVFINANRFFFTMNKNLVFPIFSLF